MVKKFLYVLAVIYFFGGCSRISVENPTDKFLPGKRLVRLEAKTLGEISGGAASINNPKYFWVHNDSGNNPDVFLIDENLNILMKCTFNNIENRDWEDIAVGPGPENGKSYIYIGEIGDNLSQFSTKHIYRVEEPKWDGHTSQMTFKDFDTISFTLDVKKDTETLLLDPLTRDLYIISKREDPVWVYRLKYPQSVSETTMAEKLITIPFTQIVGGDFSGDGKMILLKNYEHVYYWENSKNKSVPDLLKEQPFEIPYEIEPQGESIMWARDNSGFYTLSEKNKGKDSFLYFYKARK